MANALQIDAVEARTKLAGWPWIVAILWLCASLLGLGFLWNYANTPGMAAQAPPRWPTGSTIEPNSQGATLVMFAHPHCPCTRASMRELEKIVAQAQGRLAPWIVVYTPANSESNWEQTDLWRTAAAIPGAHVIADPDGVEARRFHVVTSGQTLLYDVDGKLLFSGGITGARGHEGDNAGQEAVVDLLTSGTAACRESPVFGCPIIPSPANQ